VTTQHSINGGYTAAVVYEDFFGNLIMEPRGSDTVIDNAFAAAIPVAIALP